MSERERRAYAVEAGRGRLEGPAGTLTESSSGRASGAARFLPLVSRVGSLIVREEEVMG